MFTVGLENVLCVANGPRRSLSNADYARLSADERRAIFLCSSCGFDWPVIDDFSGATKWNGFSAEVIIGRWLIDIIDLKEDLLACR